MIQATGMKDSFPSMVVTVVEESPWEDAVAAGNIVFIGHGR